MIAHFRISPNPFVQQGYLEAAKAFERESGASTGDNLESAESRSQIRSRIQSGQIPEAVELINDLYPEVGGW